MYSLLATLLLVVGKGEEEVEVPHSGEDCWAPCGNNGGYCAWCGSGNACCRQGWVNYPPECKHAVSFPVDDHHTCVALVQVSVADFKMALVLLGSVSTFMTLYYLINFDDVDMRKYTYHILSDTCAIFCAVMVYSSLNQMAEEWLLRDRALPVVLAYRALLYLAFYFVNVVVLLKVSGLIFTSGEKQRRIVEDPDQRSKTQNSLIQCTIFAHMTGFAGIGFWTTIQTKVYPFYLTPLHSFLVYPAACVVFALFISTSSIGRELMSRRWMDTSDEDIDELCELWNESVEDAEHDTVGLWGAFLVVQSVRFAIGGSLPGEDGAEGPVLFTHEVSDALWLYAVAALAFVTLLGFVFIREKKALARRASQSNASEQERGEPLLKHAAACVDRPRAVRGPAPAEPTSPERSAKQSKTSLSDRLATLQREAQLHNAEQLDTSAEGQVHMSSSFRRLSSWTDVLRDNLPVLGRRSPMTKEQFKSKVIQHRGIAILKANISMCFSWSSFFATQWLVASFTKQKRDFTVVEVLTAAILSHLVFLLIRILDKCADNHLMGNLGERAVRRTITSLGLLVGFGWEKSFHASIEAVAAYSTLAPLPTNIAFALLALIVIMPHWRRFIIPMVEEHGYRYGFVPRKVCSRVEYMIDHKEEGGLHRVHEYGQVLRKLASVKGAKYFKVSVTAEGRGHSICDEVDEELYS
jgi:hypothetical protein